MKSRIRDTGGRRQEAAANEGCECPVSCIPSPGAHILNPEAERRLRWRCRRGLLELDIVLARFVDSHYARLSEAERDAFDVLLEMPDNPLWDMIAGQKEAAPGGQQALLEKIRAS